MQDLEVNLMYIVLKGILLNLNFMATFLQGLVVVVVVVVGGGGAGLQSSHKKKLKSEIFNDKKSLWANIFFSVITKNSNWEVLPKSLVTFKIRWYSG